MLNMIRADLFKMYKSSAIKILFGITIFSSLLVTIVAYLIPQGKIDAKMAGMTFLFSDVSMISILGAVTAGIFICGDFDNKTIHEAITSGCSRIGIIIGKAIAFYITVVLMLLPYIITTVISLSTGYKFSMGSMAVGFLNLMTQNSGLSLHVSELSKLFAVIFTLLIVYVAQLSLCIPLAFGLKKPVLLVAIIYGISILSGQLTTLRGKSTVLDNIISSTPFGGNYSLLTITTDIEVIIKAIFISLVFMIEMIAITNGIFRKSELK